jgi:glycosyltransferase involved in cell wall biosynthesis
MTAPPGVWCAIPVYNNAATVKDVATRARARLENVLVIDDGSTDANVSDLLVSPRLEDERFSASAEEKRSSSSRGETNAVIADSAITVIRHPVNCGKGAALLTAMRYAHAHGAKYLITLDADGQHFPEDIPRFFPHLAPDTILIGRRAEITGDMPGSSRFGRDFSDFWIQLESGRTVLDSQSGFRAYPLPACLDLTVRSVRYGFEVEVLTQALWSGLRSASIPIRVHYPPRDQRVSSFHPLRDNVRLTGLHTRLIARQLLPLPHRRTIHRGGAENAEKTLSAFNYSLAAAISTFFSIVLWPWGFIPVAYLTFRLHLSKVMAIAFVLLCLPPVIARLSHRIGQFLLHMPFHPGFERFVGSHVIAFPACLAAGAIVYTVARRLKPEREA